MRKPNSKITRQAWTWNPQGKRKRGGGTPGDVTYVETYMTQVGLSWQ